GMDRINVDKKGLWSVTITDTPQPAPGATSTRQSLPVTINKMNAMNALSKFSSQQPGRYASYAVDNSSGTVWEPDSEDAEPSIMIELSPATRFDEVQLFEVDAVRIMFGGGGRRGFGRGAGAQEIYKYKIEVSMDGENWQTALDRTNNTVQKNTIFEEFKPVECRFIRLTVTDWPKPQPLSVIEFTAFGLPSSTQPARVAIPHFK
ncbi:MAG: discoidin domain-containing protein, partial [Bacteroidaceae bacterium]|nr:discoidin domain-containing protein [Bacteroidaceae bacterium]